MKFEESLCDEIEHNALLFLERGVRLLTENNSAPLSDKVVMACADIQIALELALRAHLIRMHGLRHIVDAKQRAAASDAELESLYMQHKLKVTEFDSLKNSLRSSADSIFDKYDFKIIERFQIYRNKIVHFCCNIGGDELRELHDDLLYYVVQIVLRLIYNNYEDLQPADYFVRLLGYDFYRFLWYSDGYEKAIVKLAHERASSVGVCPICEKEAYDMDEEFCYLCNIRPQDSWGRADCLACGSKRSVIYDRLNIHLPGNRHSMPGFCQVCESHPEIFECPKCGQTHWMHTDHYDWMCDSHHCATLP